MKKEKVKIPEVVKREIETIRKFEFSASYLLSEDNPGRVRTELTINYAKKEYYFLDGGRFYLEDSNGHAVVTKFKEGSVLDATFKKMFGIAEYFAKKEIKKGHLTS